MTSSTPRRQLAGLILLSAENLRLAPSPQASERARLAMPVHICHQRLYGTSNGQRVTLSHSVGINMLLEAS